MNIQSAVQLGAQAALEHQRLHPGCDGQPNLMAEAEECRGLAVSEAMQCKTCGFTTQRQKLYTEIPQKGPGRRTATPNMAFQVGLYNTGIATAGARRLLASMDTAVPSRRGLQKSADKCGEIITEINLQDMAAKRATVKHIHELQGFDRDSPVAVEMDRQYNNPLRHARKKTLFVPATQTRDTVCENVTSGKFVVMYHHENKLCKSRAMRQSKGQKKKCPDHTGCTATRPPDYNMGDEEEGGKRCAEKLMQSEEPLLVNSVTTDGDGHMAKGLKCQMRTRTNKDPVDQLDPPHLNRSLCRSISRAKFSATLFPEHAYRTDRQRKQLQNRFGDDISHRAQAEASAILQKSNGDVRKMKKLADKARAAIPKCYAGNHTLCRKGSQICNGNYGFPYMPRHIRGKLNLTTADELLLEKRLAKRIGHKALRKTRYGMSTQKSESVNHAFGMTNPKGTLTFSKNAAARDHSSIHLVNNRHANSIVQKCNAAGCPISSGSPAAHALAKMDKQQKYHKKRAKSNKYKRRRAQCRGERYHTYFTAHALYQPGQLHPEQNEEDQAQEPDRNIYSEHSYCKMYL